MSASKFAGLGLEVDKPRRMTLLNLDKEPIRNAAGEAAYIDLYSGDSDIARRHRRTVGQDRIDAAAKRGRIGVKIESIERAEYELLAALTTGWKLIGLDGADIDFPFSTENAVELYSDPATAWIFDQVNEFAGTRANFSKASPKT